MQLDIAITRNAFPAMIHLEFDVVTDDLLMWKGQVVMSRSEEAYFERIFEHFAYLRQQSVLEIGFGLGISARLIQKYLRPAEHDIVEIESQVFRNLEEFSLTHASVRPIAGDWKEIPGEGNYDFIFYDPYDYVCDESPDDARSVAALKLKSLLKPSGILCHPHFGDGDVPDIAGFETIIVERLTVAPINMADGTTCSDVAVVYHRSD
jgi:spermidine synthase